MSMDELPLLSEALKFDKKRFQEIVRDFLPYNNYCGNDFIPERMKEWCVYLKCDGIKCLNVLHDETTTQTVTVRTRLDSRYNVPLDLILPFNSPCFDIYFCIPPWASKDYHYVLGVFCLMLTILSLVSTTIYTFSFMKEFNKKTTSAKLLISQALCDILFMIITLIALITIYTPSDRLADQVRSYASFHVYMVLYLLPFAVFFESLSVWIVILLIFDRYNYLNYGSESKTLLTSKLCFWILLGISLILGAMASLRILYYDLESWNGTSKYSRLVQSRLGKNETYNNMLQFWLKMPFESFLPLSIVCALVCLVLHKWIYFGVGKNLNASVVIIQEHILMKSIVFIGCLLLLVKVPKLILHILKYERGIHMTTTIVFELVCHFLDQVFLFVKSCIVYRYMCPMFSSWLQNKICFDSGFNLHEYIINGSSRLEEHKITTCRLKNRKKRKKDASKTENEISV